LVGWQLRVLHLPWHLWPLLATEVFIVERLAAE
jgi:hypothetical protein